MIMIIRVVELQRGLHDVALLSSRVSYSTTFHNYCSRGERLGTAKCLKAVAVGKQGQAQCSIILL